MLYVLIQSTGIFWCLNKINKAVNQINNKDDLQKVAIDACFGSEDEDNTKPPESKTLDCAKDIDEKLNDELFEEITPGRRPQEFEESEYANRSSIVVDKFYKNQGDYLHEDNEEYDNDGMPIFTDFM